MIFPQEHRATSICGGIRAEFGVCTVSSIVCVCIHIYIYVKRIHSLFPRIDNATRPVRANVFLLFKSKQKEREEKKRRTDSQEDTLLIRKNWEKCDNDISFF